MWCCTCTSRPRYPALPLHPARLRGLVAAPHCVAVHQGRCGHPAVATVHQGQRCLALPLQLISWPPLPQPSQPSPCPVLPSLCLEDRRTPWCSWTQRAIACVSRPALKFYKCIKADCGVGVTYDIKTEQIVAVRGTHNHDNDLWKSKVQQVVQEKITQTLGWGY